MNQAHSSNRSSTQMSKVILVTGSSRGIGRAICKQLAKQGYSLISTYKSSRQAASDLKKEIEETTEVKVHPIQMVLLQSWGSRKTGVK